MVQKLKRNQKNNSNCTCRIIDINKINGTCVMEASIYGQIKDINKISKGYYPELKMELLEKSNNEEENNTIVE